MDVERERGPERLDDQAAVAAGRVRLVAEEAHPLALADEVLDDPKLAVDPTREDGADGPLCPPVLEARNASPSRV